MKRSVYKYVLEPTDRQTIEMPQGAIIRAVATQYGQPTLWAEVPATEWPTEPRFFRIAGTGHEFEGDGLTYLGTCHDVEGMGLVFHVFEFTGVEGDG